MTLDYYLAVQKTKGEQELYEGYLPTMDKVFYGSDVVEVMLYAKTELIIEGYSEHRLPKSISSYESQRLAEEHFKDVPLKMMLLTIAIDVE